MPNYDPWDPRNPRRSYGGYNWPGYAKTRKSTTQRQTEWLRNSYGAWASSYNRFGGAGQFTAQTPPIGYYNPMNPAGVVGVGQYGNQQVNSNLPGWQPNWLGGGFGNMQTPQQQPVRYLPGWQPNWLGGGYTPDPLYSRAVGRLMPDGSIVHPDGSITHPDGTTTGAPAPAPQWNPMLPPAMGGTQHSYLVPGRSTMDPAYTNSWAVAQGLAAPVWGGGRPGNIGSSAYIPGVSPEPGQASERYQIGGNDNPWKAWQANRKRRFQDKYGNKDKGAGISGAGVGSMAVWNP